MLVNLVFLAIFIAGAAALWYRVSLKIPELVAIPDQVITERFHEDSARLRLFLLHIKTYYREGLYKQFLWRNAGKILYRFHLMLLRLDNWVNALLRGVRARVAPAEEITDGDNVLAELEAHVGEPAVKPSADYWQKVQSAEISKNPAKGAKIDVVRRRV